MPISEPLARALKAGRAQLNEQVAQAKHRYPAFDVAAFRDFLAQRVDAVVSAVAAADPERAFAAATAAYDAALDLVGHGVAGAGAREPWIDRAWTDVLPHLATHLADRPLETIALVSNAATNIGKIPGARIEQWLDEMARFGARTASIDELKALGQVLAWRCGLPNYRAGALQAADRLPPALALTAVGAENAEWSAVRVALHTDAWWSPSPSRAGHQVGAFTGFGGIFAEPPKVRAMPDGFMCRSGERHAYLVADAFGAVLLPATAEEFESADDRTSAPPLEESTLVLPHGRIDLGLPPEGLRACANTSSVAVTSPYSFGIRVLPLR